MDRKLEKISIWGYAASCLFALITVCMPLYRLSIQINGSNDMIDTYLKSTDKSYDMLVRGIEVYTYWGVAGCASVGLLIVLFKYMRIPALVMGLIAGADLLLMTYQVAFTQDTFLKRLTDIPGSGMNIYPHVVFEKKIGFYLAIPACILIVIFSLMTFINVPDRNRD